MISRRAAKALAQACHDSFTKTTYTSWGSGKRTESTTVQSDEFYDFLYEREYEPWFCNLVRSLVGSRGVLDFVMKLHTGESIVAPTKAWTWPQRTAFGQKALRRLGEDMMKALHGEAETSTAARDDLGDLTRAYELDGYVFKDGRLRQDESDTGEVREAHGVISDLYRALELPNQDVALHHLKLSEDHYVEGKWDDSIGNSRKFLEQVLREVASAHSNKTVGAPLTDKKYEKPVEVRQYLEGSGLLDKAETEATAKVYGLLSHTGGHPYIAEKDQARLLRHLALTFAQFVMLRWQGMKSKAPK